VRGEAVREFAEGIEWGIEWEGVSGEWGEEGCRRGEEGGRCRV
jgi:hypothetical protein